MRGERTPASGEAASQAAPPVLLERVSDEISRITLNRPDKRNAMNHAARTGLISALEEARSYSKVVIITGTGSAFCAGVDLKEKHHDSGREWRAVQEAIRRHPAIVIAAVNGFALGGGMTLINVSDLAVAAEEAEIGMPEVTFGVYPAMAGPSTQLRLSQKRAAWMVLSGERIGGVLAEQWGLVNKCVSRAELEREALAMARRIAKYDPVTLEYSKKALWDIPGNLSEWTAALEYGELANGQIQRRRSLLAGADQA